ncbi:MAG: hypothetical protein RBJ76_03860 [Stenomitos frigidus ULC029]
MAFSPGDKILASGSQDETGCGTGKRVDCVATLQSPRPYEETNSLRVTGMTEAPRSTLQQLGAVDQ